MSKPAQTGLVDMGDISFYDHPRSIPGGGAPNPDGIPSFTLSDLDQFTGSFSEMVLNVTWAQLQPVEGGPLVTTAIDGPGGPLSQIATYNSQHGTNLGVKLRVWGGFTAPDWAKNMNGQAITVSGEASVDPYDFDDQTIGRFWTADYIDAWTSLQSALAQKYDGNPLIRGISQTAGAATSDEPFVPLSTAAPTSDAPHAPTVNQVAQVQSGGMTDAAEMLTLRAAIADYAQWSTTPLDYTMNTFHLYDSGTELPAQNFTLAVLQQARNSTRMVQAGNHRLQNPLYAPDAFVYLQLAADAALDPSAVPASYQTASPEGLFTLNSNGSYPDIFPLSGKYADWPDTVVAGVRTNAGNIELWDIPRPPGGATNPPGFPFPSLQPDQIQFLATLLAAGNAPTTHAPDDGSALAFLAPAFATGSSGTIAFTGVNCVLLESASSQASYTVTLSSTMGGTLAVKDVFGIVNGPKSGPSLSLSGSLSKVNTVLASLTDTLSAGSDVVHIVATDGSGHTAVRDVGAKISASATSPRPGSPAAVLSPFRSNGILAVGGVQSALSVPGNLEIGGAGNPSTLLAALAPSAYSTANLSIGAALNVHSGGTGRFTGALTARSVNIDTGGTVSGDGTLTASGSSSIVNNGTIEAVADLTIGLQRLRVANAVTGTGGPGSSKLIIDAGATLDLVGAVDSTQAIEFASNTVAKFANGPYSPSTLLLEAPLDLQAAITGFTFADRLVLLNVTLSGTPTYDSTTGKLTVDINGTPHHFSLAGTTLSGGTTTLTGLSPQIFAGNVIAFVASATSLSVMAPSDLEGAARIGAPGFPVVVPNIVVNTSLPSISASAPTLELKLVAAGTLTANGEDGTIGDDGTGTLAIVKDSGTSTLTLSGRLDQIERSLQTLTYTAPAASSLPSTDSITIFAGYGSIPAISAATIQVHNNAAPLTFDWNGSSGAFDLAGNWSAAGHVSPPGGTNVASFGVGTYTVSGDGAVGQIVVTGTTTLTGQVTSQGRVGSALSVDTGGVLNLAGGAVLTAQQQATIGGAGQGLLTVMGGALSLPGTAPGNYLVLGDQISGNGTVLDLEQITAYGTVVVGNAGSGTLELRGVASSVIDGAATIGAKPGSQGSAIVNGGEWMTSIQPPVPQRDFVQTSGLLIVGDQGTGSLQINGMAGGIAGQVTACDAAIGNQAGGQGSVMLDGGEFLIADVLGASSLLTVGGGGTGDLAIENNSEVEVGVAGGTVANNNGVLIVGGAAGGRGRVRIGGNSALLVYGNATVGDGSGQVTVGESADDIALFALMGTLTIGGTGQIALGGANATLRASGFTINAGGTLSGAGTLAGLIGGNGTMTLANIDNDGSIDATDGNLLVYGSVTGTGELCVESGATLTLQAAVASGQTLAFSANAKAVLNDPRAFSGTITGFEAGDVLELASTHATRATWANGILTLDDPLGPIQLRVAGAYGPNFFTVQSDGLGGTFVSGGGNGDVHMKTFDGLNYDFQAVGDFVAVRSTLGPSWQIQIRTDSFPGATSITTALAVEFGGSRVSFAVGWPDRVHVDGVADTALQAGVAQSLGGGTLTALSTTVWQLSWGAGESLTVADQGDYFDWSVALGAHDGPGSVQGLLGSHSGRGTDFQLPDGTVLRQPLSDEEILGVFANAWRVAPGTSILDQIPPAASLVQAMAANLVPTSVSSPEASVQPQEHTAGDHLAASPLRPSVAT
jgi:hypothetical protein